MLLDWDMTYVDNTPANAIENLCEPTSETTDACPNFSRQKPSVLPIRLRINLAHSTTRISAFESYRFTEPHALGLGLEPCSKDMTVADELAILVDSLQGMTWGGLTRLGIVYVHSVNSKGQICDSWVRLHHADLGCH
jgi:hypothetical protein